MTMKLSHLNGPQLFLFDAVGAGISGLSLLIPYFFEEVFGMPKDTVISFILIAIVCVLYSTVIYLSKPLKWKSFLMVIALINLSYCLFTAYQLYNHAQTITLLGYAYFLIETGIIVTLSLFEIKVSRSAAMG